MRGNYEKNIKNSKHDTGCGDIIVVNNDGMRSRSAAGIRERVLPVCGQHRG